MARNNQLIEKIYQAGPSAFSNNFDCYLLQETSAGSAANYEPIDIYDTDGSTKLIDYRVFATRIEKISIPSTAVQTGDISYGNEKITVAGSKLEYDNKAKITIRLDEKLYTLGMLNAMANTTLTSDKLVISNTHMAFGTYVAYTALYRPRLTFIVRRGSAYQMTDSYKAGAEANSLLDASRKSERIDSQDLKDPDAAANPGLYKGSYRVNYDVVPSATQMNQFAIFEDIRFLGGNDINLGKSADPVKADYEFVFKHLSFERT